LSQQSSLNLNSAGPTNDAKPSPVKPTLEEKKESGKIDEDIVEEDIPEDDDYEDDFDDQEKT